MTNKTIFEKTANKVIELHGSMMFGKALEKATIEAYCEICNFGKKYILQDLDYDNVSESIACYHSIK